MNKNRLDKGGAATAVLHPELAIFLRADPQRDEECSEIQLLFLLFIMNQYAM